MSKYTLELRYLYEDENFNLFDFPYNLYNNDLKPWFEEKFYQHFMFYEIGFDTIGMFKQRLMSKLNDIFPYYKQLYETEIRTKGIDFMLNKDLKESYVRELTSNSNSKASGESSGNSKEEYTLTSQGNIGITSSAELLAKWREVLLNLDLMIFEECNDLFMQIF